MGAILSMDSYRFRRSIVCMIPNGGYQSIYPHRFYKHLRILLPVSPSDSRCLVSTGISSRGLSLLLAKPLLQAHLPCLVHRVFHFRLAHLAAVFDEFLPHACCDRRTRFEAASGRKRTRARYHPGAFLIGPLAAQPRPLVAHLTRSFPGRGQPIRRCAPV